MTSDGEDASSPSQSEDEREDELEMDENNQKSTGSASKGSSNGQKSSAKDPSKPRRKKARRACLACQRAHLTCGDERPCTRCIKRGLGAKCQDGIRKKAKYLHDAPPEALMPGVVGEYPQMTDNKNPSESIAPLGIDGNNAGFHQSQFMPQMQAPGFQPYPSGNASLQMRPPSMQDSAMMNPYGTAQSPMSPPFSNQRPSLTHNMVNMLPQNSPPNQSFPLMSANDPNMFNIDVSGMNFGNHYGALEFGMLNHMSSGANEMTQPGQPTQSSPSLYDASTGTPQYRESSNDQSGLAFTPPDNPNSDWTGSQGIQSRSMSLNYPNYNMKRESMGAGPFAFSIGAGPTQHVGSPGSMGSELMQSYIDQNASSAPQQSQFNGTQQRPPLQQARLEPIVDDSKDGPIPSVSNRLSSQSLPHKKRKRDPTYVYESVKAPYAYTQGFHALTALIRRRFSSQKRLRIAQALGQIRPSFIACTRELQEIDLIYMEKWFQRCLLQYDDYINAQGSPTIVFRRTGEVAIVGKEFSLLTGWRRDVLMGREPNLNVNTGGGASGLQTGASTRGFNTPRGNAESSSGAAAKPELARPQPVFLAELLDDDSIIAFYEEFAKVAFADSRVTRTQRCMVLKYKTKEDPGFGPAPTAGSAQQDDAAGTSAKDAPVPPANAEPISPSKSRKRKYSSSLLPGGAGHHGERIVSAEAGMKKLGDKEGKVDCMCTWMVKRDLFDMPMMIVFNFLPVLERGDGASSV